MSTIVGALAVLALGVTAVKADDIAPAAGSVQLRAVGAPDPDGGPPWGLRTFTDSASGVSCIGAGRVVGGVLGNVDKQGVFSAAPLHADRCQGVTNGAPPSLFGWDGTITDFVGGNCGNQCSDYQQRTFVFGSFGSDLVHASFTNVGSSTPQDLPIDHGYFLAVVRGLVLVTTAKPRIALTFDSGCGAGRAARMTLPGAQLHGCTIVVPNLLAPVYVHQSAASLRARKHPSTPVEVTTGRVERFRLSTAFGVTFRAPITTGPNEGYRLRVRGPGGPSCHGRLDETTPESVEAVIRRGTRHTVLADPLPSNGKPGRFCPGRYRADVSFYSYNHHYPPFGHAFMTVPAVR